jgi:hypothetical protein
MGFVEWMTLFGVWCAVLEIGQVNRKLDDLKKEKDLTDRLRKDVDGLMAQAWKLEDGR